MKTRTLTIVLLMLSTLVLAACGGGGNNNADDRPTSQAAQVPPTEAVGEAGPGDDPSGGAPTEAPSAGQPTKGAGGTGVGATEPPSDGGPQPTAPMLTPVSEELAPTAVPALTEAPGPPTAPPAAPTEVADPTASPAAPTDVAAPTEVPPAPTEAPSTDPGGSSGGPTDDLIASFKKLSQAKSYRVRQTVKTGTLVLEQVLEVIPPDRFHLTTEGEALANEIIIIKEDVYLRDPAGTWRKLPGDQSNLTGISDSFNSPQAVEALRKNLRNVKRLGTERVNGVQTRIYQYDVAATTGEGVAQGDISSRQKLWVGVADGLPRKVQTRSEATIQGNNVKTTTDAEYYDINADFEIEPPIE